MQTRWKTVIFWGRKCQNLRWKLTLNVKLICSFCSQESFVCSAASSHPLSFIKCAKAPPHVIIICFYHHSHQHPRLQIIQQFLRLRIHKYCSERKFERHKGFISSQTTDHSQWMFYNWDISQKYQFFWEIFPSCDGFGFCTSQRGCVWPFRFVKRWLPLQISLPFM